jgi:putative IMPACT (imprinted ancient) family translation regulator
MRTLSGTGRSELEIRRSRFVAHATRVDDLPATLTFYESVADPTASHNCWAWKLGPQYRFNDDGEPASTAGRPILAAIEGRGLDHAMVVVTRWFGGIKLGAGGLVRAYSAAAARSLEEAGIVVEQPRVDCVVEAGFEWTGQLYAALEACGADRREEVYTDGGVRISARVPADAVAALDAALRDATRGAARFTKSG